MTGEAGSSAAVASASVIGVPVGGDVRVTFSVVVPLYQKRDRILACLESIRAQTFAAREVIVVDDGSTDGGGDLVRDLPWVRYVRQDNQGVAAARNRGVGMATGDYVAFLDADDSWLPAHLEVLAELARGYPRANLLGTAWSEGGRPVVDDTLLAEQVVGVELFLRRAAAGRPPFWTSALAVRRSAVETTELFPVGSRLAEDQDAWLRLLADGYGVRSSQVTADYYLDPVNPTVARPHPDDFGSVIFTTWSQDGVERPPGYREFVAAHRLFTIERHIGHTPNADLIGHLLRTPTLSRPRDRARLAVRIAGNQLFGPRHEADR